MPRLLAIATLLLVLLAGTPAGAEAPAPWWRSFYATIGHRNVFGIGHASGTTFGGGYRYERTGWGLDANILNIQYGRDEGMHCWGRLAAYAEVGHDLWAGVGLSYGTAKGWSDSSFLPRRNGQGFQLDLIAGHEWGQLSLFRLFTQLDVTVPLYRLYDIHRSTDSATPVVGVELAAGVRF